MNLHDALNKVAKWRTVFAGWQLGTRAKGDPECDAVRDHREVTIMLRVEVNALTNLLIAKGVITNEELAGVLTMEAQSLDRDYEKKFPGFTTSQFGVDIDVAKARGTMKDWRP